MSRAKIIANKKKLLIEALLMHPLGERTRAALLRELESCRLTCPVCSNTFVPIRKQRYCSKACTDRVAQQAKRERAREKP